MNTQLIAANVMILLGAPVLVYGFTLLHPAAGWLSAGLLLLSIGVGLVATTPKKGGK